ncbi:MAG: hypothetical protein WB421_12470 [Terriglobales bacterium]
MALSAKQLIAELADVLDASLADFVVASYVEMQQRFFAGDWQPSELDGGRLCEAISRALYQLDSGTVTHSQLPKELCEKIEDEQNLRPHSLDVKDRHHISRAIGLVYKFRSDRGSVHISPKYTADFMDSMLMVHAGKWIFAEFLRLAWKQDKAVIAETIAQIVQLEYSLIHELDGIPLVLESTVSAPEEILLLLNHAEGHKLSKEELTQQAKNNTSTSLTVAFSRLLKSNEIRSTSTAGEVALTPKGQKRVIERIIPALKA